MLNTRIAALLALLIAGIALAASACSGGDDEVESNATAADTPGFHGAIATPAFQKPNMTLTDTSGKPYDIVKETEGKVTLFYLGYTFCPDICPTTATDVATALKGLTEKEREQVVFIMVTADPDRDTPEVLRKWLDRYDTEFVGLIPTKEQLNQLTTFLKMAPIEKEQTTGSYYTVNHAAYVIAFEKNNVGRLVYPFGITIADWQHDLPKLIKGESS